MINKIIENKSVILVGPAAYLEGSKKKDFIESFDVIVRLNNGYNINDSYIEDIGERTDILYHCLWGPHFPKSIPLLNSKINLLKTSYPDIPPFTSDIRRFQKTNCDRVSYEIYDLDKYNYLTNALQSRPNTGTCAIYDLMSYNLKRLHVSGITMFSGGYMKNYRDSFIHNSREDVESENKKYKVHNIQKQIAFLKKFLINPIISMDEQVKDSIYD